MSTVGHAVSQRTHRRKARRISGFIAAIGAASLLALPITHPQNAAAAPTGFDIDGRIAYTCAHPWTGEDAICTIAPDGTDRKVLTIGGNNSDPDYSPNGLKIAYTHWEQTTGSQVWMMNADGTNKQFLTHGSSPSWASTGVIAYVNGGIRTYTAGTTKLVKEYVKEPGTTLNEPFPSAADPQWSPDSSRIIYTLNIFSGTANFGHSVRSIKPDGSGDQTFLPSPNTSAEYSSGGRLIFSRTNGTGVWEQYVYGELRTMDPGAISSSLGQQGAHPTWSPSAKKIAYGVPNVGLMIMSLTGSPLLIPEPTIEQHKPSWGHKS